MASSGQAGTAPGRVPRGLGPDRPKGARSHATPARHDPVGECTGPRLRVRGGCATIRPGSCGTVHARPDAPPGRGEPRREAGPGRTARCGAREGAGGQPPSEVRSLAPHTAILAQAWASRWAVTVRGEAAKGGRQSDGAGPAAREGGGDGTRRTARRALSPEGRRRVVFRRREPTEQQDQRVAVGDTVAGSTAQPRVCSAWPPAPFTGGGSPREAWSGARERRLIPVPHGPGRPPVTSRRAAMRLDPRGSLPRLAVLSCRTARDDGRDATP
jgi:hypothetical protein